MADKKRKCLREITNTRNNKDIEYGYAVEDDDIMELDLITSSEDNEDTIFEEFIFPVI